MSTEAIQAIAANNPYTPLRPLPAAALASAAPAGNAQDPSDAVTDNEAEISAAVAELNRYVAGSRTDLRFTVDRDAGEVVVSIVDSESGQVLRQMPSPEALRIARYLEHDRLGLIRQRA